MRENAAKMRTRITRNTDTFYALVKFLPTTITAEASDRLRVASLSCIKIIISHVELLIGNVGKCSYI